MKRQDGLQINQYCYQGSGLYEETERVSDKTILLSGLYKKQGRVSDKPKLLSGLYEEKGRVSD